MPFGGGNNPPVRIDPFKDIVNVHWGIPFVYVALQRSLASTEAFSSGTFPFGEPISGSFSNAYLDTTTIVSDSRPPSGAEFPFIASAFVWKGEETGWVQIPAADSTGSELDFAGIPEFSHADTYGAWDFVSTGNPDVPSSTSPRLGTEQLGGEALPENFPKLGGSPFVDSLQIRLFVEAIVPEELLQEDPVPPEPDGPDFANVPSATHEETGVSYVIDYSGASLTYKGHAYDAVGMQAGFFLLFARSEAT
jgi:hypothetical protein